MKNFILDKNFKNREDIEAEIKSFIRTNSCRELRLDLSRFNVFDAVKFATVCSTSHFLKYTKGKVFLNLKDEATLNIISPLKLKNTVLNTEYKEQKAGI